MTTGCYIRLTKTGFLIAFLSFQVQAAPLAYTIEVNDPSSLVFHVTLRLSAPAGILQLSMPASTPGAYIQNHARYVGKFRAAGEIDQSLTTSRVDKQTWQIIVTKSQVVKVQYDVHVNEDDELRLTTNWLHDDGGFFIGTTIFMYSPGLVNESISLELKLPPTWSVVTPLPTKVDEYTFVAANYRELAESPVQFGSLHERAIVAAGKTYRLVFDAQLPPYDENALDKRIKQIAIFLNELFGGTPFEEYIVLFHWRPDLDFGGGLARRNVMVMNIGKEWIDNLPGNLSGTFTHELFHAWNFASFYPRDLGHYDYAHENYTTASWFVEGVTNYYVYLTFARTGLIAEDVFLSILSNEITAYESSPGRGWLSLTEADIAGWVNAIENLNYRSGGAVIGFLLDLEIRLATNSQRSLDDLMRALYQQSRLAGYQGYAEGDLIMAANKTANRDLSRFFDLYVSGKGPIDYDALLARAGLVVQARVDTSGRQSYSIIARTNITGKQSDLLKSLMSQAK